MKTENQLKKSYEKQLQIFEAAKVSKLNNIEEKVRSLEEKIQRLQSEREELLAAKKKVQERSFRTFQDFLSEAEKKANSSD